MDYGHMKAGLQQSGGPLEYFMLTPSFLKRVVVGLNLECFNLAPSLEQSGGPSSIHLYTPLPLSSYLTSSGPSTSINFILPTQET